MSLASDILREYAGTRETPSGSCQRLDRKEIGVGGAENVS